MVDERRKPSVHLQIESAWDTRDEPIADAKRRLRAEAERRIEAELERVAADAVGRGYVFPIGTRPGAT
jgi:hypothetical protein